ncbi:MAG: DUF721 domain-containing protein [Bacillota bacterium]|nr:DUF721 domain-containing protein [Bacillota bacterium]
MARRGVEQLGVTLERTLKRMGLFRGVRERMALVVWAEVVGAPAARNTRPVLARRGLLLVSVSSSTWAQELSLMRIQLMARLNARLGDEVIREIRFAVDPTLGGSRRAGQGEARNTAGQGCRSADAEPAVLGAGWEEEGQALEAALGGDAVRRWLLVRAAAARRRQELEARGWKRCPLCGLLADPGESRSESGSDLSGEGIPFLCGTCQRGGAGPRVQQAARVLHASPWMSEQDLGTKLPGLRAAEIRVARAAAAASMRSDLRQEAAGLLAAGGQADWTRWRARAQELVLLAAGLPPAGISEEEMKRALGDLFPVWAASRPTHRQNIR